MKFFALLLILIVSVLGQLPASPALPNGAFTTAAPQERYTLAGMAVSDPTTQYLRIQVQSDAAGTFSASSGCLPNFEFLNANDLVADSTCTLAAAGTCYLQIQPSIIQNMVDVHILVDAMTGTTVTMTPTLETITPGALAEVLDQPISGTLVPGGMALFGPLFVSAGGGYAAVGAPNHIGVILNSQNDVEVAATFMAPNTQEAINSCFTQGNTCFTSAADTCGIDVVAAGNWYVVVRDNSALGGTFDGFLELRVLASDPDFQVELTPGIAAVQTRGSNLNTIERAPQMLDGAFELVITLTDPNDSVEAFIADESTGIVLSAEPCAVAACQSDMTGVCRLEVDSCFTGPFVVTVTGVNSATGASTVGYTTVLQSLTADPATFGASAALMGQTVLQVPSATPNGAIAFETNTVATTTVTGNRANPASSQSACPDTATGTTTGTFNTIIPSCVGSTGDFFFTVTSTATMITPTNVMPTTITSGDQQTGSTNGNAAEVFSLAYDGVPTVVSIVDPTNTPALSVQTTSSSVCQSTTDMPAPGNRFVPVCAPQAATASILVGVHATVSNDAFQFTPTVQAPVAPTQGAATTFDLTAQDTHVFDLSAAPGTAALYVDLGAFTEPTTVDIQQNCQTITSVMCTASPCRVSVTNAGFSATARYSAIVRSIGNTNDNAATITFQSGTNTCVAAGLGPCTGTTGSVSVASGTNSELTTRATNDIAQFTAGGSCDATAFVCDFHFPACDGNGFVTLPTESECQAQFDACGFQCFNACNGLQVVANPTDSSSASTLTIFAGLIAFVLALF